MYLLNIKTQKPNMSDKNKKSNLSDKYIAKFKGGGSCLSIKEYFMIIQQRK